MPPPDPLKNVTTSCVINDSATEIACAAFDDRNFVAVTQYRKLGTVVSVTGQRASTGQVTYATSVLLGRDEPEVHVFARAIAETVQRSSASRDPVVPADHVTSACKPLLVTLALTEFTPQVLSRVCAELQDCKVW